MDIQEELIKPKKRESGQITVNFLKAAKHVKTALHGKDKYQKSEQANKFRSFYKKFNWISTLAIISYLLLSFFEIPQWWTDFLDQDCRVKVHGVKYNVPMSFFPKGSNTLMHSLEFFLLIIIQATLIFRCTFAKLSKTFLARTVILSVLCVMSMIDLIIALSTPGKHYLAHFVRPIIFIVYIRSVRETFLRIWHVILEAKEVMILIILNVIFFSWTGMILFDDSVEGELYFGSLADSCWYMLILLTTANYPDIMMPAYAESRWYCIFFILYLLLGLFFLFNLVLAVFYNNYSSQLTSASDKIIRNRAYYLEKAWVCIDTEERGYITIAEIKLLLKALNDDEHDVDRRKVQKIIKRLDTDNSGTIEAHEFETLIYHLKKTGIKKDKPHYLQANLPDLYSTQGCLTLKTIVSSAYFEAFINVVNVSNLAVLIIEQLFSGNAFDDETWMAMQILYMAIYMCEMIIKIGVFGWNGYWEVFTNKFDCIINIISLILIIVVFVPNDYDNTMIVKYFMLLRLLRVLSLLGEVEQYRIIFSTFVSLIPHYMQLLGVLTSIFYIFSLIGVQIFGGLIYKENDDIYSDASIPSDYIYNNFNDFPSGLLTLFELLVVNNWFVVADMFCDVTNYYARWYFIIFYILGVVVAVNLMVAFIIDQFNSQWEQSKQEREEKDAAEEVRKDSIYSIESILHLHDDHNMYRQHTVPPPATTTINPGGSDDEDEDETRDRAESLAYSQNPGGRAERTGSMFDAPARSQRNQSIFSHRRESIVQFNRELTPGERAKLWVTNA